MSEIVKDLLACLSLANLWYLQCWHWLAVVNQEGQNYYRETPASPLFLESTVVSILVVGLAMFAALRLIRLTKSEILMGLARAAAGTAIVILILRYFQWRIAVYAAVAFAIFWLLQRQQWFSSRAGALLRAATLLIPIQATYSAVQWYHSTLDKGFETVQSAAPLKAKRPSTRVVWMIFDELDYELTFPLRPDSIHMPEMDKLRSESFSATHAYATASLTARAIPSLLSGRIVSKFANESADQAKITFSDNGETKPWSGTDGLFADARKLGLDVGLTGWHHPYCRVIGSSLARCSWEVNYVPDTAMLYHYNMAKGGLQPFDAIGRADVGEFLRPGPDLAAQFTYARKAQASQYHRTLDDALKMSVDPDLGLVLIHWLIPHPPGFYDRRTHKFGHDRKLNYFDNLELVDETLGKIRAELVTRGMWDSTTLIVTGDHYLRRWVWLERPSIWTKEEDELTLKRKDPRVPLLIKLAHQQSPMQFEEPFNTVLLHDFILGLLKNGHIAPKDACEWFHNNRTRFPTHVIKGPEAS